jgi:competence protein ComEC
MIEGAETSVTRPHHVPWWWTDFLARLERGPKYQPLVLIALAFSSGIALDRWADGNLNLLFWFLFLTCSLASWSIFFQRGLTRFSSLTLLLACAAFGGVREHLAWRIFPADEISRWATAEENPILVEATVLVLPKLYQARAYDPLLTAKGDPRERPQRTRLKLRATALREGNLWRQASGKFACAIDGDLGDLRPGDRVRVAGFISLLPRALNPGEFDFAQHARADGELCQVRSDIPAAVQILQKAHWWWPSSWLPEARRWGTALLQKYLSQYEATLAGAILLGTREELPYEQTEEFLLTGTIHVLSISGMHVGILAWGLFVALRGGWIGQNKALICVIILTWVYTLMTDSEPPAVRATILVTVVCGSLCFGRAGLAFNSLAFSAIIVFLLNPNDLFRTGTQLSFISMGVLSWLSSFWSGSRTISPLDRLILRRMGWREQLITGLISWFVISFVTGTLIWFVTLPLVVARFYLISWSALVLNVFLSPIVTLAMICGFLVLATGWWFPWAAQFFGTCCDALLELTATMIHYVARTPGSYTWHSGPSDWWLIGFYTGLGAWATFRHWLPGFKFGVPVLLAYCALGWYERVWNEQREPGPRATFIAIGHGGATLIEMPDGRNVLYDCGRLGSPIIGERAVEAVLRSRGIRRLDAIIISHADTDHYNAVPELLRRFEVSQILVSGKMRAELNLLRDQNAQNSAHQLAPVPGNKAALFMLALAIEQHGVQLNVAAEGMNLSTDPAFVLRTLHPPALGIDGSDNANSIVLELEHQDHRVLLTGDLEKGGISRLLKNDRRHYDVLQAPHHGSSNNNPTEVAAWTSPTWVVLCSSLNDSVEKATTAYESSSATVLHLARTGATRLRWAKEGIEVRSWLDEPW